MAYVRTNWVTNETALSADNMNNIETGIEEALAASTHEALKSKVLNLYYPVGSYYETSDTTFNPNTSWGGTWELEQGGLVHVSAGNGYTVSSDAQDGGEAAHLLTGEESGIQAHTVNTSENGSHMHDVSYGSYKRASGDFDASALQYASATTKTSASGAHRHTIAVTAEDAIKAHNNMPPYKIVNRWHRTN